MKYHLYHLPKYQSFPEAWLIHGEDDKFTTIPKDRTESFSPQLPTYGELLPEWILSGGEHPSIELTNITYEVLVAYTKTYMLLEG